MKKLLNIMVLLTLTITVGAQLHVSILTCSPGEEVYAKFGHTAIRVWSDSLDAHGDRLDLVYHYGVFNSDDPNFISRFVRGETDYRIGAAPTDGFYVAYAMDNREIYEQELRLTTQQKQALVEALEVNYLPENRYYRYNFVFDNCATRPYYLLQKVLNDSLQTPEFDMRESSFREAITHYTGWNSWEQFGIDLCFGWDADRMMTPEERLFLPEELQDKLSEAQVQGQPILTRNGAKVFQVKDDNSFVTSPVVLMVVLVIIFVLASLYDWKKRKRLGFAVDRWLYLAWAAAGVILAYLAMCSEHPFVHKNLNLLLLNPLWLVPFVMTLFRAGRKVLRHWQKPMMAYAVVVLLICLLAPQKCHMLVLTSLLILLMRSAVGIRLRWKKKERDAMLLRHHHHHRPATALIAALLLPMLMQAESKLVVVAVVDGLNQTVLDQVQRHWNGGGFQTLSQGKHFGAVYYPQMINGDVESVVTFVTGSTPCQSGVAAGTRFDPKMGMVYPVLEDKSQTGIGTSERLSPKAIRTLTLADEFKLQNKDARVLAIGLNGSETVALAGHTAQAATWLDGKNLQWVSSGYYNEGLPIEAAKQNSDSTLLRLSDEMWGLVQDFDMYDKPSQRERQDRGFAYMPKYIKGSYTHPEMNLTPMANQAVLNLALQMQEHRHLGESTNDMLCLELTVKTPQNKTDFLNSAEQEDMYIRLDRQLHQFMQQLDQRLGRYRYVMVVVGRPVQGLTPEQWAQAKVGGGAFDVDRCGALLNLYLMAKYGHESWVLGVHGHQVYLNERLLTQKNISVSAFEEEVAQFITEFEGVQAAFPSGRISQIVAEQEGDMMPLQIKNAYDKQSGGDVVYYLKPGWYVKNPDGSAYDHVLEQNPVVPCFIYGGDVHHQETRTLLNMQEVHREVKRTLLIP